MRVQTFVIALFSLGCAGQQARGPEASTDPVRTTLSPGGEALDVTRHTIIHTQEYTVGRDRVWGVLMAAEADLGMPLQSADSAAGMAIYYLQTASPRVAGRHASVWLDCGRAPGGAPRVGTYHLTLRLTITLETVGEQQSRLRASLVAYARDRGVVSDQLPCTSSGKLERRALEIVAARLTPS